MTQASDGWLLGMAGCLTGGVIGAVLSFVVFISALSQYQKHQVVVYVILLELAIVALVFAAFLRWAPRSRHPTFVRALAVGLAIVGLGGVTVCSGALG